MSTRVDLVSFDAGQTLFDHARLRDDPLTATAGMLREAAARGANLPDLRRLGFAAVPAGHPGAGAPTDQAMETFQAVRFGRVCLMPGQRRCWPPRQDGSASPA